jgi:capsular polysaccharide biosynthesis protein
MDAVKVEMYGAYVFGRECLPISRAMSAFINGQTCWSFEFLKWFIECHGGEASNNGGTLAIPCSLADAVAIPEDISLITTPGADIFGHWYLDIIPRLYVLLEIFGDHEIPLGFRMIPPFGELMLRWLGIPGHRIRILPENELLRFDRLQVVQPIKFGYFLNVWALSAALRWFVRAAREHTGLRGSSRRGRRRLYVSREGWVRDSKLVNREEIARVLSDRYGFEKIRPHEMSLADQIGTFTGASAVVGEDGSAIHNCIFSAAGTSLLVILRPERDNYWHAGFAQACRQSLAYVKARTHPDGYYLDPCEFERVLLQVLDGGD